MKSCFDGLISIVPMTTEEWERWKARHRKLPANKKFLSYFRVVDGNGKILKEERF